VSFCCASAPLGTVVKTSSTNQVTDRRGNRILDTSCLVSWFEKVGEAVQLRTMGSGSSQTICVNLIQKTSTKVSVNFVAKLFLLSRPAPSYAGAKKV
jgi:hypothetical protein